MTTADRNAAAAVMSSEGPWEYRWRGQGDNAWRACPTPAWEWADNEYRVKPVSEPHYGATCPVCHGTIIRPCSSDGVWRTCTYCQATWSESSRKTHPCPECARLAGLCADQNETLREASSKLRRARARERIAELEKQL